MFLCTLVLNQLNYINSILCKALTKTTKPYETTKIFAARLVYKESRIEKSTYISTNAIAYISGIEKSSTASDSLWYSPLTGTPVLQGTIKIQEIFFAGPQGNQHG